MKKIILGELWTKEMMKLEKSELVTLLKIALKKNMTLSEIINNTSSWCEIDLTNEEDCCKL